MIPMDLIADARLPFSRAIVFSTYRDKLAELATYLPNVRRIEIKSRNDTPPTTDLVNIWHGGGEIPAAARAFLSDSMLSWTDIAHWDESAWTCEWRIETHAFTEAVTCKGKNRFLEEADGMKLEIRGSLEIDGGKLKGVPRLLAGKVAKTVEEVLVSKIKPNLIEVSDGVRKYLEANPA
jgi:hypothetical protein